MKNNILKSTLVVVLAFTIASFTSITEKKVKLNDSTISWVGHKVTGKHEGTVNLKSGVLKFSDNQLVGGDFTIDMTSLDVTDLEGEWKDKLVGHLKSADFFSTQNHATANLNITKVEGLDGKYSVTGDLTIKDITKSITFAMKVSDNAANAKLKIDRTQFDIKYKSASFFENLKDKAILDDFDLNVNLAF